MATGVLVLGGRDSNGYGRIEIDLDDPLNPALTTILNSSEMRAISLAEAVRAKTLYVNLVAKSTREREEHLFEAVHTYTQKTFTTYGPRWSGVMEVVSGHVLPHELGWHDSRTDRYHRGAHDLNHTLEMLSGGAMA